MPITVRTQTVFHCKCLLCRYEWDAMEKPGRCSSCKSRRWNGEDHRFQNPYKNRDCDVPINAQIEIGTPAPRPPNNVLLLETLINAKAVIEDVVKQNPCDHRTKTQCVCGEKKLVSDIALHIDRLQGLKPKRSTYLVNANA